METRDGSTIRGALLDLSQSGARIKVDNPDRMPEQFILKLSDKLRELRIAWRSAKEIGVELLVVPKTLSGNLKNRAVVIKCPKSGKEISTGMLTTAGDLSQLSEVRRFTQCPNCKVVHSWTPKEASLAAASII